MSSSTDRMIFPPQGIVSLLKDRFTVVKKVESTDPLTVKFTLSQPSPILLLVMTDLTQAIYSKKTLDGTPFKSRDARSSACRYASWSAGASFAKPPDWIFFTSSTTARSALRKSSAGVN